MTSAWDSFGPGAHQGIKRIRGGYAHPRPPRARPERRGAADLAMEAGDPSAGCFRLGRLQVDIDGAFAFLLFLPLLFIAQLGTLGAAAVAGLVPLYLFFRRERLIQALLPRAFLLVIPGFAVLSVLWSEAPPETLRYAVQFGLTAVAGLLLASARDQGAVLRGLALAFFAYVLAAVLFGGAVAVGVGAGGYAFSGLGNSKNLLADIASTGLIISAVVAMMAVRGREWLWLAICGLAIGLDLYAIFAARSAGAMVGLGIAIASLTALAVLLFAGVAVRALLTGITAVALLAVGLSYRWLSQALIQWGAETFDKDPTLTGRTYLWYRAADLIAEKPMLGRGFYAFWLQGNTDAEGLWRYFGIESRGGFTFHNTAVEILVTLGWAGLVVIGAVALFGALGLLRRYVLRPNLALVCWMSLLLYQLSRTPIETIGLAPLYFSTVLAFAALGAGFGRAQRPKTARPPFRRPQELQAWMVDAGPLQWANPRPAPGRGSLRLLRSDVKPGP